MLGLVGFVTDIPLFLIVPFAGVLADRLKRHRILFVTQFLAALQAAVLTLLVITESVALWHVILLGGILGIISAFDITARHSFIVEMIQDKDDLPNAIA